MKKLATQGLIFLVAMTVVASTFAQSPSTGTRQRRAGTEATQPASNNAKPPADEKSQEIKSSDAKAADVKTSDSAATDAKTADVKPSDAKAADTKPSDAAKA